MKWTQRNGKTISVSRDSWEEYTKEELEGELDRTIEELERLWAEAIAFRARLTEGLLEEGDGFLSFEGPLSEGYDRTGPEEVHTTIYNEEE